MSHLAIRDLDHDMVLDQAAMHGIKGGYLPLPPQGVSFADATGTALAIGNNTYAKTDTFAVAVPGASAAGSHSTAASF
jgi:urocanate hydratase